jgi:hypothetical protein
VRIRSRIACLKPRKQLDPENIPVAATREKGSPRRRICPATAELLILQNNNGAYEETVHLARKAKALLLPRSGQRTECYNRPAAQGTQDQAQFHRSGALRQGSAPRR